MGDEPRGLAEVAGYCAGGHLQQAALFEERLQLSRTGHDTLVALWVGDHRHDVMLQQPLGQALGAERHLAVGQLEQHHPLAVPCSQEGQGALLDAEHQFRAVAHFGGGGDLKRDAGLLQAGHQQLPSGCDAGDGVVVAAGMYVRGADQVGYALLDGHACQLQRRFEVGCPVVDAGQQVVVQVDHGTDPGFSGPEHRARLLILGWSVHPFSAGWCNRSSRSSRRSDSHASVLS
ncbi:hypothetical protein D9M71_167760 [compost metagenome]